MAMDKHWVPKKVSLIGQISLYLIPGIVLFIFVPAILFSYFEGWDYSISVYYTFVTLTTIGKFYFYVGKMRILLTYIVYIIK